MLVSKGSACAHISSERTSPVSVNTQDTLLKDEVVMKSLNMMPSVASVVPISTVSNHTCPAVTAGSTTSASRITLTPVGTVNLVPSARLAMIWAHTLPPELGGVDAA